MRETFSRSVALARKGADAIRPYAADLGTVAYVATAGFALTVAIAEFFSPGLVASAVAPQILVVLLLATGALSLVGLPSAPRGRRQKAVFAAAGVAAASFAFWASWYYFSPVPEERWRICALIAGVVLLLFAGAASPLPEDV